MLNSTGNTKTKHHIRDSHFIVSNNLTDKKSIVEGKSISIGDRYIIKKKKYKTKEKKYKKQRVSTHTHKEQKQTAEKKTQIHYKPQNGKRTNLQIKGNT